MHLISIIFLKHTIAYNTHLISPEEFILSIPKQMVTKKCKSLISYQFLEHLFITDRWEKDSGGKNNYIILKFKSMT